MPKQRPISTKKRTSQGYRVSVLKRLGYLIRLRQREAAEAFLVSDYFSNATAAMTEYDRRITLDTVANYIRDSAVLLPVVKRRPYEEWVEWTEERRAQLRAIAAKFGARRGLDREIARIMGLPLPAVTLARYREIGRLQAARPYRKPRARGTHGGRGLQGHHPPSANQTPECKYVSQVR